MAKYPLNDTGNEDDGTNNQVSIRIYEVTKNQAVVFEGQ